MTDDENFRRFLRSALPPMSDLEPARNLWPAIAHGRPESREWPWLDLGVAVAVVLTLSLDPRWLWLLAYHL